MGGLSHENQSTGVIYGFLKSIPMYQEMFGTHYIAFCWDSKTNKRKEIFSKYKSTRNKRFENMDDEEILFEEDFRHQMKMLRRKYLRMIGFRNIFCQKGYEADDLIASICRDLPEDDEAIIITSDQDLYQCLTPFVSIYNPNKRKIMTLQKFKKKYGLLPDRWAVMKAIAGCPTDNIPGVKGIGEKNAILFLNDELKRTTKSFERIKNFCWDNKTRDCFLLFLKLTFLPFPGTKRFQLKKNELSIQGWKKVIKELGLKSIKDQIPIEMFRQKRKRKHG